MGRQAPGEKSPISPPPATRSLQPPGHRFWGEQGLGRAGRVPQNHGPGPRHSRPTFPATASGGRGLGSGRQEGEAAGAWLQPSLSAGPASPRPPPPGERGKLFQVSARAGPEEPAGRGIRGATHTSRNGQNGKAICGVISAPSAGRQLGSELRGGQWLKVEEGGCKRDGRCEPETRSGLARTCSKQLAMGSSWCGG